MVVMVGVQDQVGVVVDSSGVPCQEQLTLPERPLALTASGLFVLSAGQVGRVASPMSRVLVVRRGGGRRGLLKAVVARPGKSS